MCWTLQGLVDKLDDYAMQLFGDQVVYIGGKEVMQVGCLLKFERKVSLICLPDSM